MGRFSCVDSSRPENTLLLGPGAALQNCHLVLEADVQRETGCLPVSERDQNQKGDRHNPC